jgi:hypothetical protein
LEKFKPEDSNLKRQAEVSVDQLKKAAEEETKEKKCWTREGLIVKIKKIDERPDLEGIKAKVIKVD